ncbi:unnamed protein product [Closterium sp. Yama58-4]|nr:unnamed protein product [Closterium sp. Yama58-4]
MDSPATSFESTQNSSPTKHFLFPSLYPFLSPLLPPAIHSRHNAPHGSTRAALATAATRAAHRSCALLLHACHHHRRHLSRTGRHSAGIVMAQHGNRDGFITVESTNIVFSVDTGIVASAACLPETINAGISLARAAHANTALALGLTVVTNTVGILTMPLLLSTLVPASEGVSVPAGPLLRGLVTTLLVPLFIGMAVRRTIPAVATWADQRKQLLSMANNAMLSFVPWMQVSSARAAILRLDMTQLLPIAAAGIAVHLSFLALNMAVMAALRRITPPLPIQEANAVDRAVIILSSQKTLPVAATVVEKIGTLMGEPALVLLPCILTHFLQIFIDSLLVNKWLIDDRERDTAALAKKIGALYKRRCPLHSYSSSISGADFQIHLLTLEFLLSEFPPESCHGGLSYDYYASTCPKAAEIVAARVYQAYKNDPAVPAPLLRLHFHDCFVQGCDASVLLDSTEDNKAEKDSDPNATLGAFDVVDDIKDHLEAECPGVVSCADILALAAREGIHLAGGPFTEVPLGRRDGLTSFALAAETFLPGSTLNVSGLVHNFNTVGLDMTDVVTLSGAHTIGEGRCVSLKNRLEQDDPTMDPEFAAYVKQKCGTTNIDPKAMIDNDYATPKKFDNQYYKNLLAHKGLFTTDQALIYDDKTEKAVKAFAHAKSTWFDAFPKSLVKMGVISPLTGTQGEVRLNCHVRNTY